MAKNGKRGPGWQKTSREDADRMKLLDNHEAMALLKKHKAAYDAALKLGASAKNAFNKKCKIASFNVMNGQLLWVAANKLEEEKEFFQF